MGREEPTTRSFRIHGGYCRTRPRNSDAVEIDQSPFRHLHVLHVLFSMSMVAMAIYGAATGWRYATPTPGHSVGWPTLLAMGLLVPGVRLVQIAYDRVRGYTGGRRIPHDAVESVELTTRSIRWYFKTRRTVPTFVIRYRAGGRTRKRRLMLRPRAGDDDLHRAVAAVEAAGFDLVVAESARELLDEALTRGRPAE